MKRSDFLALSCSLNIGGISFAVAVCFILSIFVTDEIRCVTQKSVRLFVFLFTSDMTKQIHASIALHMLVVPSIFVDTPCLSHELLLRVLPLSFSLSLSASCQTNQQQRSLTSQLDKSCMAQGIDFSKHLISSMDGNIFINFIMARLFASVHLHISFKFINGRNKKTKRNARRIVEMNYR